MGFIDEITREGYPKPDLDEVVFSALGAASTCWEATPEGVFQSDRAYEIGTGVVDWINEHYEKRSNATD